MVKDKTRNKIHYLGVVVFFLSVFLPIISLAAATSTIYSRTGFESFNISLRTDLSATSSESVYQAGKNVHFNVSLENLGKYCLMDGILVSSLVGGPKIPAFLPSATEADINAQNVISENSTVVTSCPGRSSVVPVSIFLPKDLKSGDYRIDLYLKGPRLAINGNHETYQPQTYIPFKVVGGGVFPIVKIVRSKTRFAGGVYQDGPVIAANSKQTSIVTVQNDSANRPFLGKILTSVCTFGEQSGLGCRDLSSQDIYLLPKSTQSFSSDIDINFKPDVYSIYYRLIDSDGRVSSNFKNRFIISGNQAAIRSMALNKISFKKGETVRVEAGISGPYVYDEATVVAKNISFKAEIFDTSGIFENKIYSKSANYSTIVSNSEAQFFDSFIASLNISGLKFCGTVSAGGNILESRCVSSGVSNVIFSWYVYYVLIFVLLVLIILLIWFKFGRGKNFWTIGHAIVFAGFLIGSTIITYRGEDVAHADIFGAAAPFNGSVASFHSTEPCFGGTPGIDCFTNNNVAPDKCAFVTFYFDRNNDNIPQKSEKINLFTGKDDDLYYIPRGTIALLTRPLFDDPSQTYSITNTVTHQTKKHVIPASSPQIGCVDPPAGMCANGGQVAISYWPPRVMDVVQSVSGATPTFTTDTTYTINATQQQLLNAVNANTYSDSDGTSPTTISPAVTIADIPQSLVDALNSSGDLALYDSYYGYDQTSKYTATQGQIFTNYKTRCEATNPQALFDPTSPNRSQLAAVFPAMSSILSGLRNTILDSFNSISKLPVFDPEILGKKNLLSAFNLSFGSPTTIPVGTAPSPVAVGDLNGDGANDIVVGNVSGNSVSVFYQNAATHAFSTTATYTLTGITRPYGVNIGDMDGDGKPDIIVTNNNGNPSSVYVYLQNSNGTFNTTSTGSWTIGGASTLSALADINGDGKLDIVAVNNYNGVSGGMDTATILTNTTTNYGQPTRVLSFSATTLNVGNNARPFGVAVADLNGDGKPDIVISNTVLLAVSVFLQNSNGTFPAAPTNYPITYGALGIALSDLNGDGKPDIATLENGGTAGNVSYVSVFMNNGNGTFGARTSYPVAAGTGSYGLAIGDLNADGKPDIVETNNSSSFNSFTTFIHSFSSNAFLFSATTTVGTSPAGIAIGDLNGDGKPDVVTANTGSNNISIELATLTLVTPSAPTTVPGNGVITLSWPSISDATGYRVFRNATGATPVNGDGSEVTSFCLITINGSTVSCTDTGLTNGTTYYYFLKATYSSGDSGYSSASAATTPQAAPGVPTSIYASAGNTSANVSWSAPVANPPITGAVTFPSSGYYVYVLNNSGNLLWTVQVPGTSTTPPPSFATITGLTNGTSYKFSVSGYNVGGAGATSTISSSVTPVTPSCASIPSNITNWWQAESNATDLQTGTTATLNGTTFGGGKVGQAFVFNGTSNYVSAALPVALAKTTGMTIETWVNIPSVSTHGAFVKVGNCCTTADGFSLGVGSTDMGTNGNNLIGLFEGVRWIATGKPIGTGWHHVVMVIDSAGTPIFYLDGALVAGTYSGTVMRTPTGGGVYIGGYLGPSPARYFNGSVDEVSIYSKALTATEIQNIYSAGAAGKCVPPSTPGTPTSVVAGNGQASIGGWTASTGASGYNVYGSGDGYVTPLIVGITSIPTTVAPLTIGGLTNGTAYTFKVAAYGADGSLGTKSGASSPAVTPQAPPNIPTAVTGSVGANQSVNLSWAAPSSNSTNVPTGYFMYYSSDGTNYVKFNSTPVAVTSGTVSGLTNGTPYTFKISATNVGGEGLLSSPSGSVTPVFSSCILSPSGLTRWWPGNGNANDIQGAANGTFNNPNYTSGRVDQGFNFNGINSYISLPSSPIPNPTSPFTFPNGSFTFDLWFKTSSGGVILGQNDQSGLTVPYYSNAPAIYVGIDGKLRIQMFTHGTSITPITTAPSVNDGGFHYLAVTYDYPSATETAYLDGSPTPIGTLTSFTQTSYGNGYYYYKFGTGYTGASSFGTGVWPAGNGGWYYFNGVVDEPSLYNRVLTSSEITNIYNAGAGGKCAIPTAPAAPSVAPGDSRVVLSWTNVFGASSYKIFRNTTNSTTGVVEVTSTCSVTIGGSTSSCTDTSPINGTTYYYFLKSSNPAGDSGFSAASSPATPVLVIPPAPGVPGIPSVVGGDKQAFLSWTSPTTGGAPTGYFIYYSTDSFNTSTNFNPTTPTTTLFGTVSGLTNGTAYTFKVSAVNAGGEGAQSSASSPATTPLPPPSAGGYVTYSLGNAVINVVGWNAVSGAASYKLYISTDDVNYAPVGQYFTIPTGSNPIVISPLTNGTTYYLKLSALNVNGLEGPRGPSTTATPQYPPNAPSAPTGSFTGTNGNQQITINWTAPSADSTHGSVSGGYYIYYSTDNFQTNSVKVPTPIYVGTSAAISSLSSGTAYSFKVSGINVGGEGVLSSVSLPIVTQPTHVTGLTSTPGDTQVTISWTAPAGIVNNYKVYRGTTSGFTLGTSIATPTGTTFTDIGPLTNGTTYYYVVVANNSSGDSISNPQVSVVPVKICHVSVDTTSSAFTKVTVNGADYYIDLTGVRTYLWNSGLITSNTKNSYTYPPGTKPAGTGVLQYKVTQSGFYDLIIHEDLGARAAYFDTGNNYVGPASPDSFDSQFANRIPQ